MSDARLAADLDAFLQSAIGDLTPKQRFVFECYYGLRGDREYSQGEIADLMGVSRPAVNRLLRKATETLRKVAEGYTLLICREADSEPASDGVDESVCLSPFIPSRYGLPPGEWPDGLREEWM